MQLGLRHFKRSGRAMLASALVGLVLLLAAMAACPGLHELIHHDADEPGHECAVTMFLHGQVNSPVVDVAAIIPVAVVAEAPLNFATVFNAPLKMLPPGRGPPLCFLPS